MWQFFVLLYFTYLILGPWWETKLLKKEQLNIVKSPQEFFRRSVFISYVALLFTAWFTYKPSFSSFINALILSMFATMTYYEKYGKEPGFPVHHVLNIFLLVNGRKFMDRQTTLTIILMYFYFFFHDFIYTS